MGKMQIEEFEDGEEEVLDGEEIEGEGGAVAFHANGNGAREEKDADQEKEMNAAGCPLFLELAPRTKNSVDSLKVYKVDPPGEGFRGKMPKWGDELYIAQKWGNGHFRIEAVNQVGKILRTRELQLRISVDEDAPHRGKKKEPEPQTADHPSKFAELALREANETHKAEVDRIEKLAKQVTDQTSMQSNKYLDMVTSQSLAASQRDREFFGTQGKSMQDFFSAMWAQSQQAHEHSLAMAREQFQHTVLMMQQSHLQSQQANNPMAMVSVLMKGLEMGRGFDNEEPEEGWVKAITAGVDGLKSMVALKSQNPMMMPAQAPSPALARTVTSKHLSREHLREVMTVKLLADQKGIPFEHLLAVAKQQLNGAPDQELPEEDEGEYEDEEDDEDLDDEDLDEAETDGQDREDAETSPEAPESDVRDEGSEKRRRADAGVVAAS